MKILHFCAGLEPWNGMANTAREFAAEEKARGDDSVVTNDLAAISHGVDEVCIHGAWLPLLWKAAKRAKAVGAKLVIRPAGSYDPVRLAYHGWKKKFVAPFEHRMLRRADVALATCEAEAEWIREYEPRVKKVEITDLKRFFDLNHVAAFAEAIVGNGERGMGNGERGTGNGEPLHVLYLGRRHPLKGVEYLETAVAQLTRSHPTLSRFRSSLRSGDTFPVPHSPQLKIVSNAFGDELEKIWDWCDLLVLPTLSENFGRVIAEALERGKRVITTDGAPAWGDDCECKVENVKCKIGDGEIWTGYGGRLIYLKGYRDSTDETRVELLKSAIEMLCRAERKG